MVRASLIFGIVKTYVSIYCNFTILAVSMKQREYKGGEKKKIKKKEKRIERTGEHGVINKK